MPSSISTLFTIGLLASSVVHSLLAAFPFSQERDGGGTLPEEGTKWTDPNVDPPTHLFAINYGNCDFQVSFQRAGNDDVYDYQVHAQFPDVAECVSRSRSRSLYPADIPLSRPSSSLPTKYNVRDGRLAVVSLRAADDSRNTYQISETARFVPSLTPVDVWACKDGGSNQAILAQSFRISATARGKETWWSPTINVTPGLPPPPVTDLAGKRGGTITWTSPPELVVSDVDGYFVLFRAVNRHDVETSFADKEARSFPLNRDLPGNISVVPYLRNGAVPETGRNAQIYLP